MNGIRMGAASRNLEKRAAPNTKPQDKKRKRVRRANRRTTAPVEASSSESDAEPDSAGDSKTAKSESSAHPEKRETEAERRRKQALAAIESDSDSSSSSSASESDDGVDEIVEEKTSGVRIGDAETSKQKRHRKRSRGPKQAMIASAAAASSLPVKTEAGDTAKEQDMIKLAASMPDPATTTSKLSEKTCAALLYVKQYLVARKEWKFNKARQEYLIRHMLAQEPDSTASRPSDQNDDGDDNDSNSPISAGWPEAWTPCVAAYLKTVQGGAKARFLEKLRRAAQQALPPAQATPSEPMTKQPAVAAPQTATTVKSVNFGDVAMAAEKQGETTNEAAESTETRNRLAFERTRARALLDNLNEPIWA